MTNMFAWDIDQRIEEIKEDYSRGKIKPEKNVHVINIFEETYSWTCSKDWDFSFVSLSRADGKFKLIRISYESLRNLPEVLGKPTMYAFVGYREIVFYPSPDKNYQLIMESENLPDSWKKEITWLEKMKEKSLND